MLNLREYRARPAGLADLLPWAFLVAPGVILNKDGSFQRSARFRGPDLESSTESELMAVTARVNNVLRRFGSGWALYFDAERVQPGVTREARFLIASRNWSTTNGAGNLPGGVVISRRCSG